MSPAAGEPRVVPDFADMVRQEFEAERERTVADRLAGLEALLQARTTERPSWWAKWAEPGPLLSLVGILVVLFGTYANIQTTITKVDTKVDQAIGRQEMTITALSNDVRANSEDDQRRTAKYGPMVEANRAAVEMQKLINDQVNDRIANLVKSVQDLRASVDSLREMEQRTREDLLIDKARREGRMLPPKGSRGSPPDDDPTAH